MSAQPDKDVAYSVQGNAASKDPTQSSNATNGQSGAPVSHRPHNEKPTSDSDATPSSSGRGIRGAGPGEKDSEVNDFDKGRAHADDAEQMGAPGEGKVADAVKGKSNSIPGGAGQQKGTESDLDRKKAEQAPQREAMKQEGKKEVDVGGVLGQRAAPADPSDS